MKHKDRTYRLTAELLKQYRDAAVKNADDLLAEAALLLRHERFARAYFLAVCSIEEAGKAVQAFEGLGRNLADSAVAMRLKVQFEDHSEKVNFAFKPWLQASPDVRDEIEKYVGYIVHLGVGREASMYCDIHAEQVIVTSPADQIRPEAARDCLRLAATVLSHARPHALGELPASTTRTQDAFFALKPATWRKMSNSGDFWRFYVSRLEQGAAQLEAMTLEYHEKYFTKGELFAPPPPDDDGGGAAS